MAAQASTGKGQQVLVNKQFNSPIKMYSAENVAEVLNKQTQVLENGAVGIDFHQLSAPGHLANSAVLRMLAEEERQRGGTLKGLKRVAWPPPPDTEGPYIESQPAFSKGSDPAENHAAPVTRQAPSAWQAPSPEQAPARAQVYSPIAPSAPAPAPAPLYSPAPAPVYAPVAAPAPAPAPLYSPVAAPAPAPFYSPVAAPAPAPVYSPAPAPVYAPVSAPVYSPVSAPVYAPVPAARPYAQQAPPPAHAAPTPPAPAPQFQGTLPGQPGQPQYPPPLQPYEYPSYQAPAFEPPPSTIELRPEAPISQAPFPVFESQPAATRAAAPKMRGDEKWPPTEYKARAAAENEQRIALARGPAVRPRKVNRDYSKFFAQNALTPTYPGYKAPPGTQHYVEEGTSNF